MERAKNSQTWTLTAMEISRITGTAAAATQMTLNRLPLSNTKYSCTRIRPMSLSLISMPISFLTWYDTDVFPLAHSVANLEPLGLKVFGNFGNDKGYTNFHPQNHGLKPLSVMAVVCGDKLVYGVWGDVNGLWNGI
jgi:hypothetical protein